MRLRDREGIPTTRRIPTLDDVLALLRRHPDFEVTLDLKDVDIAKVARRVVAAELTRRVVFFAGGTAAVGSAQAVNDPLNDSIDTFLLEATTGNTREAREPRLPDDQRLSH